jgi:LAO/AO transport system kinase
VQVAKAGILEIADVFVVNKADKEGAGEAAKDLRVMLKMGAEQDWVPPVVQTSTQDGRGVDELWDAIEQHRKHQEATEAIRRKRRARLLSEVEAMAAQELRLRMRETLEADAGLAADLDERRVDPYRAAAILIERISETGS